MDETTRNLERAAEQGDTVAAAKLARARRRAAPTVATLADSFAPRVTAQLGATWTAIREVHPELPAAVVVLASGTMGRNRKWGHWGASRWDVAGERAGEVLIAGELMAPGGGNDPDRPVEERVLCTLLHEAAHALASVRGVEDTSRGARYHNTRYAALAREVGLTCEQGPVYGWHLTRLAPETITRYAQALADLRGVLFGHRASEAEGAPAGGGSTSRTVGGAAPTATRVTIVCGCARRAQIAPGVFALGGITCGRCGEPFEAV